MQDLLVDGATWVAGGYVLKIGGKLVSLGYREYKIYRKLQAARKAMAEARALGASGETAVGINGTKTAINVGGRTRIPDRLTEVTIEEVKNVKHLNFTKQLRDFYQYGQDNGLQMIIHTRAGTTLSKPLQEAVTNGSIIQKTIPGF